MGSLWSADNRGKVNLPGMWGTDLEIPKTRNLQMGSV